MSGMNDEDWQLIFERVAEKAPKAFKDCDIPLTLSVKNDDGTETTIYEHEMRKDDSESDN